MPACTIGVGCIPLSAGPYLKDPAFFPNLLSYFAVLFCGVSNLFVHSRRAGCDMESTGSFQRDGLEQEWRCVSLSHICTLH